MLQQTRVEAVIPFYERFLARFPDCAALAAASEDEVLTYWSGLGYYSRARNLHRAAKQTVGGGLPRTHNELRALAGVGDYTAAAIASIAFGLAHAAVDGNVLRVVSRLYDDGSNVSAPATRRIFAARAAALLDRRSPGDFNQAMMELGATVCVPRAPRCPECPVGSFCKARAAGTQNQLPVKAQKPAARDREIDLLALEREASVFLVKRNTDERRLAGFWELPEKKAFPRSKSRLSKEFEHRIVNDRFRVRVWRADAAENSGDLPAVEGRWFEQSRLGEIPLTTIARKALS